MNLPNYKTPYILKPEGTVRILSGLLPSKQIVVAVGAWIAPNEAHLIEWMRLCVGGLRTFSLHNSDSILTDNGSVAYYMNAVIERPSAFSPYGKYSSVFLKVRYSTDRTVPIQVGLKIAVI